MKKFLSLLMMSLLMISATGAEKWVATSITDLAAGDVIAIVETTNSIALPNDGGTASAPTAATVTLNESKTEITSEVGATIQWVFGLSGNYYQFQVEGTTNYLYCTNSNTGIRVGTNNNNTFSISTEGSTEGYLHNEGTGRYVGVYNKQDWRCYTSVNSNITGQTFAFFKKTGDAITLSAPTISGETPFIGSTTVTITNNAEGANVYYTLDGTEPTVNSTIYTEPFTLTETTTVKAIAISAEAQSSVTTKVFTKQSGIETIAELVALEDNATFTFIGNSVVTYRDANDQRYLYIKDATGSTLIYGSGFTALQGDILKAGWSGKKTTYNGLIEMTNVTGMTFEGTETVTPVELTVADIDDAHMNVYGVLRGVTISNVSGKDFTIGENGVGYNQFNTTITLPTDYAGKTYDIVGVVGNHNGAQFLPTEIIDVTPEPIQTTVVTGYVKNENGEPLEGASVTLTAVVTPADGATQGAEAEPATYTATTDANGLYIIREVVYNEGLTYTLKAEYQDSETTVAAPIQNIEINNMDDIVITGSTVGLAGVRVSKDATVKYVNVTGQVSDSPFEGLNIVVITNSDGTVNTVKMVK